MEAAPARAAIAIAVTLLVGVPMALGDHLQGTGRQVSFTHKTGNEWWVETVLAGPDAATVAQVEATDDGTWHALTLRSWGAWAASFHIEPGNDVRFRAHWSDGTIVESCPFSHPAGVESCTGPTLPPATDATSREAEDFAIKTSGGLKERNGASGGAFWILWSNGYIQDTLFADGASDLVVMARGDPLGGVLPLMEVSVDGTVQATVSVQSGDFTPYVFPGIAAGTHTIRIRFTNDAWNPPEDRNLVLDVARFIPAGSDPSAPPGSVGAATLVAGNLSFPVDMTFGPDGTLYYAELASGDIRAIPRGADAPLPGAVAHVDAVPGGNGGFLGLVTAQDFASSGAFYVYYSAMLPGGAMENRVSRLDAGGETIVLDGIPYAYEHDGGRLAWMGDHLLVTTGEAMDGTLPMDPATLGGKVLRMTTDGAPAPGNPDASSVVYAMGFRNPFGIAYDGTSDTIWLTENGPDHDDEINIITPGGNYGWPAVVGVANHPSYIDPVAAIDPTIGPTGATVHNGTMYFGSFNDASVYRMDGSTPTRLWSIESWRRVLDVESGPDALYVSSYHEIYRLPVTGSAPPVDLPPLVPSAREAEDFATITTGARFSSGSASGGAYWNLWANGYMEDDLQSDGIHPLVFVARGDAALGVWPHARVYLDDALVWEVDVDTASFTAFEGPVPCEGIHTVRIRFTNDHYAPPEDRNLLLDRVYFGDPPGAAGHEHGATNICA